MLTAAVLCSLTVGWCTGGRLSRFERAGVRALLLPVAALLLQGALSLLPSLAPLLVALSYLLLLLFVFLNRHLHKTAIFAGLGGFCNALVIFSNHFRMPVSSRALSQLSPEGVSSLLNGDIPMYCLAGPDTRFLFLGDILHCPLPLIGGFASLGDILLAIGVFFCILKLMGPVRLPGWMVSG